MSENQKYNHTNGHAIPHIDLSYDHTNSVDSLRKLVFNIHPKWREHTDELEIVKFTDGITNTVCTSQLTGTCPC